MMLKTAFFISPAGQEKRCLSLTDGTACDVIVEACAKGVHRRQLWSVKTNEAVT